MRKFNPVFMAVCLIFLQGCTASKTEYTTDPYSIAYADVKELYSEEQLSAENIENYYEFVTENSYNEATGYTEYAGYLRPKANIYTFMDSEEIQVSYTYQLSTYNCTYDVTTGLITDKGEPVNTQTISVTEYLDPYFSMGTGIISADYRNSLHVDPTIDESNRYQQVQLEFTENFVFNDAAGKLTCLKITRELPWIYTHKAFDAFYGQGTYHFLQIEAEGGYCTLLFRNDNRHNVSARYFFDDGTSSGSLSMNNILNDVQYNSLVTEKGQQYILK